MNDHNLDFQGRIQVQQNHGLIIPDRNVEFRSRSSSQHFGIQQQDMGVWPQQQQPCTINQARLTELQNLVNSPNKPSSTIMGRFESLASAFYATERFMGFPAQYDSQFNDLSPPLNPHFSSVQSSAAEAYSIDTAPDQPDPKFDFRASFQPMAKPPDPPSYGHDHNRQFSVSLKENQDLGGYCRSFDLPISQLSFASHHQEKQSPRFFSASSCISTVNSASTGAGIAGKTRIRWTQDLHEKFVECVNRLGGAEKATPKAILRLMDSGGLTIFHVKSHLQKYRIAKYLPDSSEGKSEKRHCINVTPHLEATTGSQIKEALQLQLDVQRRLHEQLEIQRNLQLQIEEQGRQLKMMFDMQQRTSNSFFKSQSSDITSPDDDDNDGDAPSNNNIEERSKIS